MLSLHDVTRLTKKLTNQTTLPKEDIETLIADYKILFEGLVTIAETGCEGDEEDIVDDDYPCCGKCLPCLAGITLDGKIIKGLV